MIISKNQNSKFDRCRGRNLNLNFGIKYVSCEKMTSPEKIIKLDWAIFHNKSPLKFIRKNSSYAGNVEPGGRSGSGYSGTCFHAVPRKH